MNEKRESADASRSSASFVFTFFVVFQVLVLFTLTLEGKKRTPYKKNTHTSRFNQNKFAVIVTSVSITEQPSSRLLRACCPYRIRTGSNVSDEGRRFFTPAPFFSWLVFVHVVVAVTSEAPGTAFRHLCSVRKIRQPRHLPLFRVVSFNFLYLHLCCSFCRYRSAPQVKRTFLIMQCTEGFSLLPSLLFFFAFCNVNVRG